MEHHAEKKRTTHSHNDLSKLTEKFEWIAAIWLLSEDSPLSQETVICSSLLVISVLYCTEI